VVKVPRLAEAHAALECRLYQVIDMPHSKIILGQVVSIFVEDRFIDPRGPYVKAEELHALGEELSHRVVQKYVYQRLLDEMRARQYVVVEEEVDANQAIRLKVRHWDG